MLLDQVYPGNAEVSGSGYKSNKVVYRMYVGVESCIIVERGGSGGDDRSNSYGDGDGDGGSRKSGPEVVSR